ncbi:hypothetical protein [Petroclostridium sp. X23]|uniref:hypothetical protein n=1 Tax=Petroclostridium sp. X23 TaxID=3045146 RepID=UPI0024AD399A|nr:hypothetical protein [Petroclostridium sp. X23]WHH58281.1 hypothetical protein QKW49_21155 [Petroclostridium sp. X23]
MGTASLLYQKLQERNLSIGKVYIVENENSYNVHLQRAGGKKGAFLFSVKKIPNAG